jgi:hypothetical protein
MKRIGFIILSFIFVSGSFFITSHAFAETSITTQISNESNGSHSEVNVQNNTDSSTICINGKCTTSGGSDAKTHVCINGNCMDSDNGNVDAHSDDGTSQVHIHNTSGAPVSVSPTTDDFTSTPIPSVSPTPNISKMMEDESKKISQSLHDTTQERDSLVQQVVTAITDFFKSFHL